MLAYALVLLGVLSRYVVVSHLPWLNFVALGGSLLFFGARRSGREMIFPLAAFMASDYCLTTYVYHYPFQWQSYVTTWAWYVMAMALGWILLHAKTTFVRGAAAAILGPTSFFVVSNFGYWASSLSPYPHTLAGLGACYLAAVPFYRNDLISTSLVLAGAFAIEAALNRMREPQAGVALAGK
jgi:DMSO reductase anchor subunit